MISSSCTFSEEYPIKNPAGHQVNLDEKKKVDAEYVIFNLGNFPEGISLKVRVFSLHGSDCQELSLFESRRG